MLNLSHDRVGKTECHCTQFNLMEDKTIRCSVCEQVAGTWILSSGAEVGDEEREKLIEHLKEWPCAWDEADRPCPKCQRILSLIRQPRMVSREQVKEWGLDLWGRPLSNTRDRLGEILAELGILVEEPKKEGGEKP